MTGMKRRGRPPKQQRQQLRQEYLEVRLDAKEKQAFKEVAELEGVALSAWVRLHLRDAARKKLQELGRKVVFLEEAGGDTE